MNEIKFNGARRETLALEADRHRSYKLPCKLCGAKDAPIVGVVFLDSAWFAKMGLDEVPGLDHALLSLCGNCLMRTDLNQAEDAVVAKAIQMYGGTKWIN